MKTHLANYVEGEYVLSCGRKPDTVRHTTTLNEVSCLVCLYKRMESNISRIDQLKTALNRLEAAKVLTSKRIQDVRK